MTDPKDLEDTTQGQQTGSAPQPLDFPGAEEEPPGRPDGDQDPDDSES